ncbi:MAG: hypothetical protein WKG03_05475 [Telluria sp.]
MNKPRTLSEAELGQQRGISVRWTANFAIVSGLIMLVATIGLAHQTALHVKQIDSTTPEVQRALDATIAAYLASSYRVGALYGAISLAGAFLWRRKHWAPFMLTIACLAVVGRTIPAAMGSQLFALTSGMQGVWLGYIVYRAWKYRH